MKAKTVSRVHIVSQWAADPAAMMRLEQIVLLTQRTDLIKQLLLIPDSEEQLLKSQIKVILAKHQIEYSPPRGRASDTKNPKQYGSRARFAIAVLLGLQMNTEDGGVVADREGRLLSNDVLDRLIYAYQRYLQLHRVNANDAAVSFELFVKCWQSVQVGDAVLEICDNCGSSHGNFRIAMAHHCPVCANLNLADLPKSATKSRSTYYGSALDNVARCYK